MEISIALNVTTRVFTRHETNPLRKLKRNVAYLDTVVDKAHFDLNTLLLHDSPGQFQVSLTSIKI